MKKTGCILLIILLATTGLIYYFWRQATMLPQWYQAVTEGTKDRSVIIYDQGIASMRKSFEQSILNKIENMKSSRGQVEILLTESDANKLFASIISENTDTYPYLNAVKASRTRINNGNLDFEVVVDTSEAFSNASESGDISVNPKVVQVFRLLEGKKTSLGFSGKCGLENENLKSDKNLKIRIGNLAFSAETIRKRLGISDDRIQKALKDFHFGKFKIDDMKPLRNSLFLGGSVH